MNIKRLQKNKAFVLLFAVTISAILLVITLGVANIAYREIRFGTSAKDTNEAFFAADAGVECALLYDRSDPTKNIFTGEASSMNCAGANVALNGTNPWNFSILGLGNTEQGCAYVTVNKVENPDNPEVGEFLTTIISKGYNLLDSANECSTDSSIANRVERELKTTYYSYAGVTGGGGDIDGECGSGPEPSCEVGTVGNDDEQTACGTVRTWDCLGSGSGATVNCSYNNPACVPTYVLTVSSSATSVPMTVSPEDEDGLSDGTSLFTRTYISGTVVNVTAPAQINVGRLVYNFVRWGWTPSTVGCGNSTSGSSNELTCTININGNKTITARYGI